MFIRSDRVPQQCPVSLFFLSCCCMVTVRSVGLLIVLFGWWFDLYGIDWTALSDDVSGPVRSLLRMANAHLLYNV